MTFKVVAYYDEKGSIPQREANNEEDNGQNVQNIPNIVDVNPGFLPNPKTRLIVKELRFFKKRHIFLCKAPLCNCKG